MIKCKELKSMKEGVEENCAAKPFDDYTHTKYCTYLQYTCVAAANRIAKNIGVEYFGLIVVAKLVSHRCGFPLSFIDFNSIPHFIIQQMRNVLNLISLLFKEGVKILFFNLLPNGK